MLSQTTSQHGVPFDPEQAKKSRQAKEAAAARAQADVKRLRVKAEAAAKVHPPHGSLDGSPRQKAIYLDEMEAAWRERARDRGRS